MNSEILKALINALGGDGENLVKEFDKLTLEYPNITLLMTDVLRNGAMLAQEVTELNTKVELLKDILVDAGVIETVAKSESEDQRVEMIRPRKDEIKINDVIWHHAVDDDLPN